MAFKYTPPPTSTCRVCGEDWAEDCVHDGVCSLCDTITQKCYDVMRMSCEYRSGGFPVEPCNPCAPKWQDCPLHREAKQCR